MGKFFLLYIVFAILGNPFFAFIMVFVLFLLLDRRYTRWFPRVIRKLKKGQRLRVLRKELTLNPHHVSNKLEVGRLYADRKRFDKAIPYLKEALDRIDQHAEGLFYLGWSYLETGQAEAGIAKINEALAINPRVRYGEPYFRLAEFFEQHHDLQQALDVLKQANEAGLANAELAYRKGQLYQHLGNRQQARESFTAAIDYYHSAPKYIKKEERRWAFLARFARFRI